MKCGLWSFRFVIASDVFKYRKTQFLQRMIAFTVCFLFLKIFEKTFAAGIVKEISFL